MPSAAELKPNFAVAKKTLADVLDDLSSGPAGVRIDRRLRDIFVNAANQIQRVKDDTRLVPNAKQDEIAKLREAAESAAWAWKASQLPELVKDETRTIDARSGAVRSEVKRLSTATDAERQRETLFSAQTSTSVSLIGMLTDPDLILEQWSLALATEHASTIRAVGTAAQARIEALERAHPTPAIKRIAQEIRTAVGTWRQANPSAIAQLATLSEERSAIEAAHVRAFEIALRAFKQFA